MICGLEIHQRLAGHKLFCPCPTPAPDLPLADHSLHLRRQLSGAVSELGQADAAAAFEAGRERSFSYSHPPAHACLVEADEEPPHAIDAASLHTTLRLAQSIGAHLVDEVQVMRKTVVDGSNTSGFQRTSLVALGGQLPSAAGPIAIQTIALEEESAGILPPVSGHPAFRLDRLGVPLIEIATDPVFTTPQAAREGALAIGQALRMLPGVMRGLGTIRQDVNISIPGGARVEIKGAQDLELLPKLIENEMARQQGLIDISNELQARLQKAQADRTAAGTGLESTASSSRAWHDVSSLFAKSESKILARALSSKGVVLAAKLPLHAGLLGRTFSPGRRYGSELSDYAKSAGGVSGLIHSDEDLGGYRISPDELAELTAILALGRQDAFFLIADAAPKAEAAMRGALSRAARGQKPKDNVSTSWSAVPPETRKALEDGGSAFMRPLSGAHRMYPETDVQPIRLTAALRASSGQALETADARRARLQALLGPELGEQMAHSRHYDLFDKLTAPDAAGRPSFEPRLVATTLEQTLTTLRREGLPAERLEQPQTIAAVLQLQRAGLITRALIPELLRELSRSPNASAQAAVSAHGWGRIQGDELLSLWKKEGGELKSFMAKYRLRVEGADLAALSKK